MPGSERGARDAAPRSRRGFPPRTLDRASAAAPGRTAGCRAPCPRRTAPVSLPSSFMYSSKPSLETRHHLPKNASMAMVMAAAVAAYPGTLGGRRTDSSGAAASFIAGPGTCAAGESQWGSRRAPAPSPPSPRPLSPARGGGGKSGHVVLPFFLLLLQPHAHTHAHARTSLPSHPQSHSPGTSNPRARGGGGGHCWGCLSLHASSDEEEKSTRRLLLQMDPKVAAGIWAARRLWNSGALDPKLHHLLQIIVMVVLLLWIFQVGQNMGHGDRAINHRLRMSQVGRAPLQTSNPIPGSKQGHPKIRP